MKQLRTLILIPLLIIAGCAQVPKESVELSATVGRDMVEMQRAHTALVELHYDQHLASINQFIDDVYLPWQVQQTLADDIWKQEILSAIESASGIDPTGKKQQEGLQKIEIFMQVIYEEVESYRRTKLEPIEKQKAALLTSLQESYERIHYANSIVTGHLASVVKVHNTQNELLKEWDMDGMRDNISVKLSDVSGSIKDLTVKAKEKDAKLEKIVATFDTLLTK
ncbi:MAG: hypothetical protein V7707_05755 [Motiliproteus sp.]